MNVVQRIQHPFVVTTIAAAVLASLVLADGATRRPANPNAPLAMEATKHVEPSTGRTLRVATFNIRGGRGRDGVRDLGRIASTLDGVDLVVLQEVHGTPFGAHNQCCVLGERMRMASLFCPTERRWWGDSFGNGLLTRLPVSGVHRIPLGGTQDRRFRSALLTVVPLGERSVRILSVHLDDRADHDAQLAALTNLFLSLEQPAVLMGDLNTSEHDPQWRRLAEAEGVTAVLGERWPGRKPLRGVDWIIARGLRCCSTEPRDLGGSDHPALIAELELIDEPRNLEATLAITREAVTETISASALPGRR